MAKTTRAKYARKTGTGTGKVAERYTHPEQTSPMRPEVGTQAQFRKKKPPRTYRYDSSLSPSLDWDGQNGAREQAEWLLALIEQDLRPDSDVFTAPQSFTGADGRVVLTVHSSEEAVAHLERLSAPFLDWAGKAERLSFDVPTLPLFVHERLSTKAIVDLDNGQKHEFQPDFIVRFRDRQGDLVLETEGFDPRLEVKAAAAERWVAAVNADGRHGHWQFAMARSLQQVREALG